MVGAGALSSRGVAGRDGCLGDRMPEAAQAGEELGRKPLVCRGWRGEAPAAAVAGRGVAAIAAAPAQLRLQQATQLCIPASLSCVTEDLLLRQQPPHGLSRHAWRQPVLHQKELPRALVASAVPVPNAQVEVCQLWVLDVLEDRVPDTPPWVLRVVEAAKALLLGDSENVLEAAEDILPILLGVHREDALTPAPQQLHHTGVVQNAPIAEVDHAWRLLRLVVELRGLMDTADDG
mmetsp:Transcript_25182/g.75166  ORF Transcript_25182/g.75166 Transcript_25182/m.75166 type:complete len:234 (-) Transcript_25182:260-961(-)